MCRDKKLKNKYLHCLTEDDCENKVQQHLLDEDGNKSWLMALCLQTAKMGKHALHLNYGLSEKRKLVSEIEEN